MSDNTRHVLYCSSCNHYFLSKWWGHKIKCPKCSDQPVEIISYQKVNRWRLKDARQISEYLRNGLHDHAQHFAETWAKS